MTSVPALRLRLRWWHLALAAVVLSLAAAVVTACVWRAANRARYQQAVDRLHAAGLPASVDDFVALAPAVDHGVQDAWDAWQKSLASGGAFARPELAADVARHQAAWDAWVTGGGPPPAAVAALLATHAPRFAAALPLLRRDGLVATGFGWMAEDLPPGRRRLPFTTSMRIANLFACRELALWLRLAAALADDPAERLADLGALHAALQRPASLIDGHVALMVGEQRDRAHLELALIGRLPEAARAAWLAEGSRCLRELGDAFSGESVMLGMGAAAMFDAEGGGPGGFWQHAPVFGGSLNLWVTGYRDCAIMVECETHIAQRLRGERADAWTPWEQVTRAGLGPLGRMVMPNLWESAISGLQADALQRAARLAVRVTGLARAGTLPADQAALLAALGDDTLLAPSGDHLHLRYEVPAPGRFRLVIDPASPLPNFDDPLRMPVRTKAAGTPPAKEPLVWQQHGLIEIRLPPPP
jgi:hypothetical protein